MPIEAAVPTVELGSARSAAKKFATALETLA
jgi:hypothetical protein